MKKVNAGLRICVFNEHNGPIFKKLSTTLEARWVIEAIINMKLCTKRS